MTDLSFLLDTDTVIYIRSGRRLVLERFASLRPGTAAISVISYGELLFGVEKSGSRDEALARLAQLTERIPVDELPLRAAAEYADIRMDLGRRGALIGPNDLWIAAHARARGLTLITANEREFRRVPGLAVENWAAA